MATCNVKYCQKIKTKENYATLPGHKTFTRHAIPTHALNRILLVVECHQERFFHTKVYEKHGSNLQKISFLEKSNN